MRAILILGIIFSGVVYIILNIPPASDQVQADQPALSTEPPLPNYTSYIGNRVLRIVILESEGLVSKQNLAAIGSKVCQYENICQSAFWSSRTSAPPAYFGEMTNAELSSRLGQYQKNSNTGLFRLLVNCKVYPSSPTDRCL